MTAPTATPTPMATPRYVPTPAPRYVPPRRTATPKPAPTRRRSPPATSTRRVISTARAPRERAYGIPRRFRRGWPALRRLGRAGLIGVAVLAGLLLGGAVRSEPPAPRSSPRAVSGAGVRLQLPSGWARGGASACPGSSSALWLRNGDAGPARRRRADARQLADPAAQVAHGATRGAPETVRLRSGLRGLALSAR